ncbi:PucR family transcriptional regulator [Demetria terragena]|uniref:PucR family transcriptional regulator n=1 Tax=Demetria terragena TaxID=63959 RepID=UPI00036F0374|nr:helix-turn-helix domain-containing protein [Demetria terragena]
MDDVDVKRALRDVSTGLLPRVQELGEAMAERVRCEVRLYRESDVVPPDRLLVSCVDNFRYVLGGLAGTAVLAPDVPRAVGRERAEQGVPYAAVLQAYRVGGRFIWEVLVEHAPAEARELVLRGAAEIWSVTDELQGEVTDAYRATLVERARHDTQVRSAHLATLLDGDSSLVDQLLESVTVLDLPRHAEYAVVAAQCRAPGQEALPGIEELLRRRQVASAWRVERDMQDGVVALRKGFGLEQLVSYLSEVSQDRVGVSQPFERMADAHAARRQARTASLAATPHSADVVCFDAEPLAVLLAGSSEAAESMARQVLGGVLALREDDRAMLLETARVWLAVAGSTSAAAESLHVHRNTVGYRLRRLHEITGRDLAQPVPAAEVHVALEAVRVLGLA